MKVKLLAFLNLFALIVHICFSWLSQSQRLSTMDVGEVSNRYDTLFAPSGTTFTIWAVIYVSLLAFCVFHAAKAFRKPDTDRANADLKAIGWWFVINNLATALWLLAWVNEELVTAMALIIVQLYTLIQISISARTSDSDSPLLSKIFTHYPLSLYLGWISVATIANVSAVLVSVSWQGWGIDPVYWTVIMLGVTAFLSIFIILVRRNIYFGLPVTWALYGIAQKRADAGGPGEVQIAAWTAFVLVCLALVLKLGKGRRKETTTT